VKLEEKIRRYLKSSPNEMAGAFGIARYIEMKENRKRGSMHLAVKLAARRMEAAGEIVILSPKDQHDTYTYCLCGREK